jgi:uncharacterized membrane protein YfcA
MEGLYFTLAGALVGFIVGITGIGGGSLMTPALLMMGIPAATAVGTDLMYAAITKGSGAYAHALKKNVNWRVALLLGSGSLPATLLTVIYIKTRYVSGDEYEYLLKSSLGIMLIMTALVILLRKTLLARLGQRSALTPRQLDSATVVLGFFLGIFVTLTSVGAGAVCAAVLMLLYPSMKAREIVGTDIAHAVPLTLIAGIGHALLDNINWMLLLYLVAGSVPAIHLGTHVSTHLPEKVMKMTLALLLLAIGTRYAVF